MTTVKRLIGVLPIAALATFGTGLLMMKLIETGGFVADDSPRIEIGAINPVEHLPPEIIKIKAPELERVEVPPAPPIVERNHVGMPATDIIETLAPPPPIALPEPADMTKLASIRIGDVRPLVRIPPAMPVRAERSGHCKLAFDVSAQGSPYNVRAIACSQKLFERASVKSVQKWKYRPQYRDGQAVPYIGLTETIRFNLHDEKGHIIAE
jgi:protein TonB